MFKTGFIWKTPPHSPGNNVFASAPTDQFQVGTSYALKKQFTVNSTGSVNANCELRITTAGPTATVDIRVNDVSVYTDTTTSTIFVPKTVVLTGLTPGATIKYYIKASSSLRTARIQNASLTINEPIELYTAPTVNLN